MQWPRPFLIILLGFTAVLAAFFTWQSQNPDLVVQPLSNLGVELLSGNQSGQKAFLLPVAETNYLPIRDFNVADPEVNAKAAVLYDTRSGRIIYSQNANQRLPIASITKLMTAVVVLENSNLSEVLEISAENVNVDGTGADFQKGEKLYGRDLFKIMLIKSSNDAALTFTTEAQKKGVDLIQKMNQKAQELAMYNTQFDDPSGLDDFSSFSTAADLVKLVSYASRYNEIAEILRTPVADVYSADHRISHHLVNTNRLLGQLSGLILGKTGYTDKALGTMATMTEINPVRSSPPIGPSGASSPLETKSLTGQGAGETSNGVNNGRNQLISVVLGAHDRFGETVKLIEWAKGAYRWE